jgi:predicted Ser/Thr protein kinase
MDHEPQDPLEAAYLKALECDTQQQRARFLDELAREDPETAEVVKRLIDVGDRFDDLLEQPASVTFGSLLNTIGKGDRVTDADLAGVLEHVDVSERSGGLGSLDGYELYECIAVGTTGFVFRARDHQLDRPVAIKVLAPSIAVDTERRAEFVSEARIASRIGHPNVVTIHHVQADERLVYFVMEWIEGETLQEWCDRSTERSTQDALRLLEATGSGLRAIHRAGIIHRDRKPGNVLLEHESGRVVVIDFGLAQEAGVDGQDHNLAGTPLYMAPEQIQGLPLTTQTDLFSLGAIGWLLLTGRHPFVAAALPEVLQQILDSAPERPEGIEADRSQAIEVISRCLVADRPRRWPSVEAFLEALDTETPGQVRVRGALSAGRWAGAILLVVLVSLVTWWGVDATRRSGADDVVVEPAKTRGERIDATTHLNYAGIRFRLVPPPADIPA